MQIRNRINNPRNNQINNPINNPINSLIGKLDGTKKLRNTITNDSHGPITQRLLRRRRDADLRARLRALNIVVLTRIAILRRVYAMKCAMAKIFDPTSSGWNDIDSWRTLDWLARNCLDFSFYIGLDLPSRKL